jgi:hypothetical protein
MVQVSISGQSAQVEKPFDRTHFRMSQVWRQWANFTPSTRQPVQLIDAATMSGDWNMALHSRATFSRSASSLFTVAIRASHTSQLIPQQEIS